MKLSAAPEHPLITTKELEISKKDMIYAGKKPGGATEQDFL
jgi:hypothetical protein